MADEQRIWAPWRLGYITGAARDAADAAEQSAPPIVAPTAWRDGADAECFICQAAAAYSDEAAARRAHRVVHLGPAAIALLNRYPYANGHLLVSPLRHVAELEALAATEQQEMMDVLTRFTRRYRQLLRAEGFNIGLNLGRAAGAGVPGHLHWHLVPRWPGDSNFMPAIAGARVIPQSLDALWEAIVG